MPTTTVAAIVHNSRGSSRKLLLARRDHEPFRGYWCLPGGHIDQYESARKAVIREVKEETGLDFDARFLCYFDEIIPNRNIHAVVIVFVGPGKGELRAAKGEVSELGWFSLDEVRSLPLAFTHNELLDTCLSPKNGRYDL
jgi:8-oxo-dGTP diphosphatase